MKPSFFVLFLTSIFLNTSCNKDQGDEAVTLAFTAQSHPIQIGFVNGSAAFVDERSNTVFAPRGTNYFNIVHTGTGLEDRFFHAAHFNTASIIANLRKLKNNGYNTIRIFIDSCGDDPECIGNAFGPGLHQDYIKNIVTLMQIAKDEDIFLILTSNDLPSQGGYWEQSNLGASDLVDGYRNSHYLTTQGVASAVLYWEDFLKALYKEEAEFSHVLAWSILNEQWFFGNTPPFSLNAGNVTCANGNTYSLSSQLEKKAMAEESVLYYINEVSDMIKSYDSDGLVTMGVFAPNYPNEWRRGDFKYVETSMIVNNSSLDFLDLHLYPATSTMDNLMSNFNVLDIDRKPIIMGEVGAFIADYSTANEAKIALQQWIATSCEYGFDGWLTWGLNRAPLAIGDATWSLLDAQEHLMIELSPTKYPDACNEEWLGATNIALGKPTTASNSLEGEPASNAVDGDFTTQWGSGKDPAQWIEIDLGNQQDISRISLLVAQFPAGNTEHVVSIKGSTGGYNALATFSGVTTEGDRLVWEDMVVNDVRYIKVETTTSPSWVAWKEIEVY